MISWHTNGFLTVDQVRLVGTDEARIVAEASRLLDDPQAYREMARGVSPYGDGQASQRIAAVLRDSLVPHSGAAPVAHAET